MRKCGYKVRKSVSQLPVYTSESVWPQHLIPTPGLSKQYWDLKIPSGTTCYSGEWRN